MFEIDWIKDRVRKGEYYFSRHAEQERQNDNLIRMNEVEYEHSVSFLWQ